MASRDEDLGRRAELAKELGFFPATLDSVDIERHRRLNATLDAAPTREQIASKFAHLRRERRRTEIEERGRRDIADLYDESDGEAYDDDR
jgi:hypothetical protein